VSRKRLLKRLTGRKVGGLGWQVLGQKNIQFSVRYIYTKLGPDRSRLGRKPI
jgi:hypothetical protein